MQNFVTVAYITVIQKFDPKPSEVPFSTVFSNFHKYRPDVPSYLISGMTVHTWVWMYVSNLVILGQTVLDIYDGLTL